MRKYPLASFLLVTCVLNLSWKSYGGEREERIRAHIQTLASPEFEGRAPLTTGETKTLAYLKKEFEALNLQPVPGWGSFEQHVPLASTLSSVNSNQVSFGKTVLDVGKDITVESDVLSETLSLDSAEVVFVGYGIKSDAFKWNDYANLDVKGKIVITLVNDPGFTDPQLFQGKDMTYFGRWKYKFEEARRQGAIGAFVIHQEAAAGYGWSVAGARGRQFIIDESGETPPLKVHGWITEEAARRVFKASRKDFDSLVKKAARKAGTGKSLNGSSVSLSLSNDIQTGKSKNLCGYLPGKTLPNEYVMLSAHWDHLGKKIVDGVEKIYPGAIDNASGVAALLELARSYDLQNQSRSMIFCSFTAEEQGLLGAKYFATHPPFPLESLKGVINLDSLNVGTENPQTLLYGRNEGKLENLFKKVAAQLGREVISDPHGERGYFFRSDHYPFVSRGVPGLLFLDIGFSNPDYLNHHYHQSSDVYHPEWPLTGLLQDMDLFSALLKALAGMGAAPERARL